MSDTNQQPVPAAHEAWNSLDDFEKWAEAQQAEDDPAGEPER
jgi:hypothetical protein